MDSIELLSSVKDFCKSHANPANVEKYSHYFKETYVAYGLTQPQQKAWIKEQLKNKELTLDTIKGAAPGLFKSGMYEEIMLAMLLIEGRHKQFTRETFQFIETLFSLGINNWAHADTMGMAIVPKFLKQEVIAIEDLRSWLTASNKFQRRTVPVALIKSIDNADDVSILFGFIESLMTDADREVHQGVGWFLREAWKRKPQQTEKFLATWKNTAPRLIFQYACEKMTPEQKARFKRAK